MSQLTQITIVTVAGGSETITVQGFEESQDIEAYNEQTAVGGRKYRDIRGSRGRYRLSYDLSIEQSTFRSAINNIVYDLSSGQDDITIIVDGDYHVVVPTDDFMHNIEYGNTIGRFVPDMEFVDVGKNRFTGTYVETGYVEAGYVE